MDTARRVDEELAGNPHDARPPMKFHNYWTMRTPKGWSCLFVAPVNRSDDLVQPANLTQREIQ